MRFTKRTYRAAIRRSIEMERVFKDMIEIECRFLQRPGSGVILTRSWYAQAKHTHRLQFRFHREHGIWQ